MFNNTVELSHFYLQNTIKPGDFVVDATCGKGGDTAFLASLVGESGTVLAFDIQKEAIKQTSLRLENEKLSHRVELILDGHEHLEKYLGTTKPNAVVFNLGYLPGGDHSIHTKPTTTIQALKTAISSICAEGIVCVSIYHGKDSGFEERDAILQYLKSLDFYEYNVILHSYSNKPNYPPMLAVICHNKKIGKGRQSNDD